MPSVRISALCLLLGLTSSAHAQVTDQTIRALDMQQTYSIAEVPSPTGMAAQLRNNTASLTAMVSLGERPPYLVTLSGAGEFAGGAWPQAHFAVDGTESNFPVVFDSTDFQDFFFLLQTPDGATLTGSHRLTLSFQNDYDDMTTGEDRNLIVDTMTVTGTPLSQAHSVPLSLGATQMAFGEGPSLYLRDTSGPMLELLANGYVEESLLFPTAGSYDFILEARADGSAGNWPLLQLAVDGIPSGPLEVNSMALQPLTLRQDVTAGTHRVRLSYINDDPGTADPTPAPNLSLGTLRVQATELTLPSPPPTRYRVGFNCAAAPGLPSGGWLLVCAGPLLARRRRRHILPNSPSMVRWRYSKICSSVLRTNSARAIPPSAPKPTS